MNTPTTLSPSLNKIDEKYVKNSSGFLSDSVTRLGSSFLISRNPRKPITTSFKLNFIPSYKVAFERNLDNLEVNPEDWYPVELNLPLFENGVLKVRRKFDCNR